MRYFALIILLGLSIPLKSLACNDYIFIKDVSPKRDRPTISLVISNDLDKIKSIIDSSDFFDRHYKKPIILSDSAYLSLKILIKMQSNDSILIDKGGQTYAFEIIECNEENHILYLSGDDAKAFFNQIITLSSRLKCKRDSFSLQKGMKYLLND